MSLYTRTLIIGAGPAGLAVAGRLRKMGEDFEVVEQSDKIAFSWQNHYDRLCLHTVKQLSHLPHLPFPEDYPLYVPRLDLVRYYENYAKEFNIKPHFNESVISIEKIDDQWITTTKTGKSYTSENVVIGTGVNRVPHYPTWEGQDSFKGEIVHSRDYKNPKPFLGKKVLVVGMGNTGSELALDLAEHNVDSTISVRSPITIVPRDLNGRPVQLTAKTLAKLPFGLGDWLGTMIRKVVFRGLDKFGLPLSKVHPAVQLRETGKTPIIDLGTVDYIRAGKIQVVRNFSKFTPNGVVLETGEEKNFDAVILSTGYRAKIDDFIKDTNGLLDRFNLPKKEVMDDEAHKGMYFIGFDNYKLGGLLGTIFSGSEIIADHIKTK